MNLIILDIAFPYNGQEGYIYPVVLQYNKETVLVDCGYEGFTPLLEAAMNKHGLSLQQLTGLIITHHDIDHMGAAHELKQQIPTLKVYTSGIDKPYVSGRQKSLRLQQAEAIYEQLPEEQKPGARSFQQLLESMKPVPVDESCSDNEKLSFLPGVQVINTPGHMPGHISLYVSESKTLIAADALVYEDEALAIANPQFTMDMKEAIDSVRKLQRLEIKKIVCYHGGLVDTDIASQLQRLLDKYQR